MTETINIGGVKIERTAALAPMASVADRAYRYICREYGAAYMVSEMISAKGLCYSDRKTEELCTVTDFERPYALQLFGDEEEFIAKAAIKLMSYKPDIIDINMGCPVPKIAGNGSGSALLKDPDKAVKIAAAAVNAVDVPVTVKMRTGWDDDDFVAPQLAAMLESVGVAAITIHGRTKKQMYSGLSDNKKIAAVKTAVKNIPVIGNGDIKTAGDALRMYRDTGVDLVMAGRGTYGHPWLFSEINAALKGDTFTPPDLEKQLEIMCRQAELMVKFKGERMAMAEARRICAFYIRGIPGAAGFRGRCGQLSRLDDIYKLRDEILTDK